MVAFEPSLDGFAHLHPLEKEPKSADDAAMAPLLSASNPGASGNYRFCTGKSWRR